MAAAYALLLPRAHWTGDEYYLIAAMRDQGWALQRSLYLHWSPRPFSNALYAVYGYAVNTTHRPLAGTCMALLWAGLGCACVAPALAAHADRGARAVMGLAIFTLLLSGHAVTEVFFWPGGGLSYVPTLAGAVWLFWCLADGAPRTARRKWAAGAALALAAASSEVGMFLALAAGVCIAAAAWREGARAWWLAPGMAVAALDLGLLLFGRVSTGIEASTQGQAIAHHAWPSLLAALPRFAEALLAPDADTHRPLRVLASVASRVAAALAARLSVRRVARGLVLPAYAAGLLVAAFATIASAYYQFGVLCCERHDTMRACYITLAFVCLGAWSASPRRTSRPPSGLAALAWSAAVLLVFVPRALDILADIRGTPAAIATRAANWASGRAAGREMVLTQEPGGRVIATTNLPVGVFLRGAELPWYDQGILSFFRKDKVEVR